MTLVNDGNIPIRKTIWACPICETPWHDAQEASKCCPRPMTPGERAAKNISDKLATKAQIEHGLEYDIRRAAAGNDRASWLSACYCKLSVETNGVEALISLIEWLDMSR